MTSEKALKKLKKRQSKLKANALARLEKHQEKLHSIACKKLKKSENKLKPSKLMKLKSKLENNVFKKLTKQQKKLQSTTMKKLKKHQNKLQAAALKQCKRISPDSMSRSVIIAAFKQELKTAGEEISRHLKGVSTSLEFAFSTDMMIPVANVPSKQNNRYLASIPLKSKPCGGCPALKNGLCKCALKKYR